MRVYKSDTWTSAHNYTWGPGGVLFDSNNSSTYTPGFAQNQGGADRYLHSDWIGSTRYMSDSTGNNLPGMLRFDAFGDRSATSGTDGYYPTPSQFVGGLGYQTEYASGAEPGVDLEYLDQRYYAPAFGRFITPDPTGIDGGLNLYGYAGNDPVNGVDPSGESWVWVADAAAVGLDAYSLHHDLSDPCHSSSTIFWENVFLYTDIVAALLPAVPPIAGASFRTVRGAVELAHASEALARARALGEATRGARLGLSTLRFAARTGPWRSDSGEPVKYNDPASRTSLRGESLNSGRTKLGKLGLEERVTPTGRHEFFDPKNNDRVRAAWDSEGHWHKFPPAGPQELRLDNQGRVVPYVSQDAHIPAR